MQYKKHPIDRALEALAPILAPSFTLRSYRDKEGTVLKYPLIDYAIAGTTSKVYDASKNQWRSTYLVIFEILVQEKKVKDWCDYTELADAQDKHALFLAMEVIVEQFIVLLTKPKSVSNLIRPLDTIYADLFFQQEGAVTTQNLSGHGVDKLTGIAANFEISCIDSEGGACCLVDFNNTDQLQRLRDLMQYGSVSWNLLNQAGANPPVTACDLIRAQLNDQLLNDCVLPLYDFTSANTQNALSAQQILDLKNWLLPQYDFGDAYWQNLLTAQQDIDLTFYILPLVDFTDPLIQAIVTTQQKTDILNWLFPLLDFSQPSTQALVTSQQQIDLSNWLCGGVATEKSTRFDGINEQYTASQSTSIEIERTDLFTMDCWVYPEILGVRQGISSKFNTVTVGRGWDFQILADNTVSFRLSSDSVAGNIITCTTTTTLPLNTWTHVLVTYLGNSVGSGMKIYFNAVEQSVTQIGTLTGTTIGGAAKIFRIGASIDGVTPILYFKGYLYNFRLAKGVVLAPAEIVTAYQIPLQPYPQLANLSFACKLGTKGYFGTTTWVLEDYAGGVSGVQGINVDLVDITTFLPPNT